MTVRKTELNIVKLYLDTLLLGHDGAEFHTDGIDLTGVGALATLQSIEWVPTVAEREGGLGDRGQVICKFKDFAMQTGGNYFRRLFAANPYYINRKLIIQTGYYSNDEYVEENFSNRLYFIKKITGPDQDGIVSIEAADVLTLLDESQVPMDSSGNLSSSLSDSATGTINIGDNTGFSAGAAIIDDEIVQISGVSGDDSIVIAARAQGGTTAAEHDADAPVRMIYASNANVVDVLYGLIQLYSDIDVIEFIDSDEWDNERDLYLASDTAETWVTESKKTSEVIDSICKQFFINIWWDDESQLIKIKSIGPRLSSSITINDDEHILNTRFDITRDQKNVITQVWVYFDKINQAGNDDAKNYRRLTVTIDSELEAQFGAPSIRKIFADSISGGSGGSASRLGGRLIAQNREPLDLTIDIDDKDSSTNVGDAIFIDSNLIQDEDGANLVKLFRVISKRKIEFNRYRYSMIFTGIKSGMRYGLIGPNTLNDYTDESYENQKYAFIAAGDPPVMSDDDSPYLIL